MAADLRETRPRFVKGFDFVRDVALSPSGARAVVEFRGEIVTLPAEKGDPRNVTNTPAAHERNPRWSPDGTRIAYFSDESGEYALHVRPQDGKGDVTRIKLGGAGFYAGLLWSPDSQKIAFTDNSQSLFYVDLATGAVKRIGGNRVYSHRQRPAGELVARLEVARVRGRHAAARDDGVRLLAGAG